MSRPLWFVELLKIGFPGRFLIAELTKLPLIGKSLDRWLFDGDDMMYLPKDQVIQLNQRIDRPEEMVLPSQVVEHFIEKASHHWIMNKCICRDASRCKDYSINLGCLFLGEAAEGINPELGRRVTREEALEHAKRCRDAGLVHLIGRNKIDTVWLGVGPGDRLLTICNCCPCCCLWRALPHIAPQIGVKIGKMPGVTVAVTDRCTGCGTCTEDICFVNAISVVDGHAVKSDACRGCGRCVSTCPHQAIEISIHNNSLPDSIHHLSQLVAVS
ncbi:MAG: 4Fe-4S ferredoxin [Chloroflexi bacterium]|nr:4Fe-4S ferredoxin [Chloroflexota bacterium]